MRTNCHSSTSTSSSAATSSDVISIILALSCLFLLLTPSIAHGLSKGFNTNIISTLTDSNDFGGCMIKVDRVPDELSCKQNTSGVAWLSSRCDTESGRDSFRQAQVALLTTGKLAVWVDDTDTTEGFCNVYRTILAK